MKNNYQVLFFNTRLNGGAAKATINLFDSLMSENKNVKFYYSNPYKSENLNKEYYFQFYKFQKRDVISRGIRRFYTEIHQHKTAKYFKYKEFFFDPAFLPIKTPFKIDVSIPTIIHLHWISGFIDYPSFFKTIPDITPIVWTLHDDFAFTAGCHFAFDCRKYITGCEQCPQLSYQSKSNDFAALNYFIKKKALSTKNLHIVGISDSMTQRAKESGIFANAKSFSTIRWGVNPTFKPVEKKVCRQILNIPSCDIVLGIGAAGLFQKRKGFDIFMEAVDKLSKKYSITCLIFGDNYYPTEKNENLHFVNCGWLDTEFSLNLVYAAMDIFVVPSREEPQGQVVLEAMASGTLVIGSNVGGIPDMIEHLQTGLLIEPSNSRDLVEKIEWVIKNDSQSKHLVVNALEMIESRFKQSMVLKQYIELYNTLI